MQSHCLISVFQNEFAMLRDVVVQLVAVRGEDAWKQMRYDLEVACSEMRLAENQLVEATVSCAAAPN